MRSFWGKNVGQPDATHTATCTKAATTGEMRALTEQTPPPRRFCFSPLPPLISRVAKPLNAPSSTMAGAPPLPPAGTNSPSPPFPLPLAAGESPSHGKSQRPQCGKCGGGSRPAAIGAQILRRPPQGCTWASVPRGKRERRVNYCFVTEYNSTGSIESASFVCSNQNQKSFPMLVWCMPAEQRT